MVNTRKNEAKTTTYMIVFWAAINIVLMLMMIPEDYMDLNNWIELVLWSTSIAGLLAMKKWSMAFTAFTLIYTLSTSVSIIIYYQVWLNVIRVMINGVLIAYFYRTELKLQNK